MIINVQDVSMVYSMPADRTTSLKEFIISIMKHKHHINHFHALQDISFSVDKGEVLGIIGNNGAGKSTLLKIISGILRPTTGSVSCAGRIVPMLELGSGLDYDLSGRENIYLSGSILGYSKKFLEVKYDDIVAFSELNDFIEIPLRNYSSGMVMRLAFSIASVVEPEILIVDEILSVGDEHFQQKSRTRMMEMMLSGTTVLFVSHNIKQIIQMAHRVLWLDHGSIVKIGDTETVCNEYSNQNC